MLRTAFFSLLLATALSPVNAQTESPRMPITDDPYLWLEEVEGERALDFVRAQNSRTLAELEADPRYPTFLAEPRTILTSEERIPGVSLRGGFAYNFWQDSTHVRGLWRRMPAADYVAGKNDWQILIDVDALATAENENWVYEGASCLAPDFNRCIITLSRGGSDAAVRREYDLASASFPADGFNLPEAKAATAWVDGSTLLVGTDLGDGSMTDSGYPRKTLRWQRGTPIASATVVFEGEKTDVGVWPFAIETETGYINGIVRARTFFESEFHLFGADGKLTRLPLPAKADLSGFVDGRLIVRLNEDWTHRGTKFASGAVIGLDLRTQKAALVFAPADRQAVEGISTSDAAIYLQVLDNINGQLLRLTPRGNKWTSQTVGLPANGVVGIGAVDQQTDEILVYYDNPTTPSTLYHSEAGKTPKAIRSTPAFFDATGIETRQYEARSKDGTRIPYFVMGRTTVLNGGPAPVIQYGYGGFQVSLLPNYSGTQGKLWLENGGVYVIANIRGGGEFGPAWHQAGLKTNRQRIYDDFYAVSEDLIARKLTTPAQLGILGGSNGGLLMGVAMTQRPELYNAIGIGVPLLDMLRFHLLLAGASWVDEYGSPDVPAERAFLESISPYHNLRPGTEYPRVYFFTSTKDDRVHPGHARKMAARLAEMGKDFLYYENIEGGHGAAANLEQSARRLALQYVYFARQLGLAGGE